MGKNFDDEVRAERLARDKTFVIGGVTFRYIANLTPEEFGELVADYVVMDAGKIAGADAAKIVDETIKGFLATDEDGAQWDELRARRSGEVEDPAELAVTAYDMRQVLLYLIQEQTGRPTEAPSRSGNGRESTGRRSTEPSSSAVVASGG